MAKQIKTEFTLDTMTYFDEYDFTEDNAPLVIFADVNVTDELTGEIGNCQLEIWNGEIIEIWEGKNFWDTMLNDAETKQIISEAMAYDFLK
jgi:hypothetical protein